MAPASHPQHRDLSTLVRPMLQSVLAGTGWEIVEWTDQVQLSTGFVADHLARLRSGAAEHEIIIEDKLSASAQAVHELAHRVEQSGDHEGQGRAALLFVPRMSAALGKQVREAGLGYFDLYGTCLIRLPGLFIERPPQSRPVLAEQNLPELQSVLLSQRDTHSPASVFGTKPLKRHRVLRALLSYPGRRWHQTQLAAETGADVSSAVHHVVRYLQQEHYAEAEGKGPSRTVALTRPGELLDTWVRYWGDSWRKLRQLASTFYSPEADPDALQAELARGAEQNGIPLGFTLAAGANCFGAYLRDDQVHAYVSKDIRGMAEVAGLEPVERGANVTLIPAGDEGLLYLPSGLPQGAVLPEFSNAGPVCPVQLYLDMTAAGGRYAEQARRLREEVIGY